MQTPQKNCNILQKSQPISKSQRKCVCTEFKCEISATIVARVGIKITSLVCRAQAKSYSNCNTAKILLK